MVWFDLHSVDKEHSFFHLSFTTMYFQFQLGLSGGVFLLCFLNSFVHMFEHCVCIA